MKVQGALAGITVLDLTQLEAGPFGTQMLAGFGARVIKVERPGSGEYGRAGGGTGGDSLHFIYLNCNKESVALDLKTAEGREMVKRMIPHVDVVVENFKRGTTKRMGLSYDDLKPLNEGLIYACIRGFPESSPMRDYPAFDPVGQATGGAMSLTGEADAPPMRAGFNLGDSGTGLHLTVGILAALMQRNRTGKGQLVEVSMQEAVANYLRSAMARTQTTGQAAVRVGNGMASNPTAPCGVYPCAPGGLNDYVTIYVGRRGAGEAWPRLLTVIGREDLIGDPRVSDPDSRYENREFVDALLSEWTITRTKHEVMEALGGADIPCGAVLDTGEVMSDPSLGLMFRDVEHPRLGQIRVPVEPIHLSESDVTPRVPSDIGADTDRVLRELAGADDAELAALRTRGVSA